MSHETPTVTDVEVFDLDCSGLLCPLPVYKAALALTSLAPGDRLRLTTTDPGAVEDIPAMTRQRGDLLISQEDGDGRHTFIIEKGTTT
ncbi:MAG TPA: sulfurtransferase TusA family protein [Acidimicrobiia bacterium]|nr:sulfurtransferase TusA family protein [Acidimicrobiia bacterium]